MSYKEKNPEDDLFRNNTQFQNLGGLVCCTCSYCAEKSIPPQLKINNFRSLEPIINPVPYLLRLASNGDVFPVTDKQQIFQTQPVVRYFAENFIPSGEFTYNLDFDGYANGEAWYSPDLLKKHYIAKAISYLPFKNCSGVPTSLMKAHSNPDWYNNNVGVYYNQSSPPNIKAYGSSFLGSTAYYWLTPYITGDQFLYINQCNSVFGGSGREYNCYPYTGSKPLPQFVFPCDESALKYFCGEDNGDPIIPPTQPGYAGDYQTLINYIESHDFSVYGVKFENNCSNDFQPIASSIQGNQFGGFQFPFVHQYYEIDNDPYSRIINQIANIPDSPSVYLTYFSFDLQKNIFNISFTNPYVARFSIVSGFCNYASETTLPIDDNYYLAYTSYPFGQCAYVTKGPGQDYYQSTIYSQLFYQSGGALSLTYDNGDASISGINAGLAGGLNGFKNLNQGSMYSTTDENGLTTLIAKDVSFIGPDLVSQLYKKTEDRYYAWQYPTPGSLTKMPMGYLAKLSSGFKCDIELKFQSSPLCRMKDIPGYSAAYIPELSNSDSMYSLSSGYYSFYDSLFKRLNSVEEFKVKFENVKKYEQYNLSVFDIFNYFYSENQEDAVLELYTDPAFGSLSVNIGLVNFPTYANQGLTQYGDINDNIVFSPPDMNLENEFVINRKGLVPIYEEIQTPVIKKHISVVFGVDYEKFNEQYFGRIYSDDYEREEYKNCLIVSGDEEIWKTGNMVKIEIGSPVRNYYTQSNYATNKEQTYANSFLYEQKNNEYSEYDTIPKCFAPPVNAYKQKRFLYCIFVKRISDNTQNAGNILIRLADTYQKAIDNDYIVIDKYAKSRSAYGFALQVEFNYYKKDVSQYNAPYYSSFNYNDYAWQINPNFQKNGVSYYGEIIDPVQNIQMFLSVIKLKKITIGKMLCDLDYNNIEVISLHPLKIRFPNSIFVLDGIKNTIYGNEIISKKIKYSYQYPLFPNWTTDLYGISYGTFGFQCDIIFEENIRESGDNKHAYPVEFNEILDYKTFIQTSGIYNDTLMSAYRNPEKCTHIGKVIDRKDCNCPKKWIRQCEIHETTDWKKCMSCPNYQPED